LVALVAALNLVQQVVALVLLLLHLPEAALVALVALVAALNLVQQVVVLLLLHLPEAALVVVPDHPLLLAL
jgi:hypothetical protein